MPSFWWLKSTASPLFPPAVVHIGWSDIVQSFVVALAVVVVNEAGHRLPEDLRAVIEEQVHLGLGRTEDNLP